MSYNQEKCGIIGIASSSSVAKILYHGLRGIQHRGQESAGMVTFDGTTKCIRGMGLVHEIFDEDKLKELTGNVGIGHVRYSTTGRSKIENAQPVLVSSSEGDIAVAHNGDIVNSKNLRNKLQSSGCAFLTNTDSEIIVRLLVNELSFTKDVPKAVKRTMKKLNGSYSLVILKEERVFSLRDPLGIKPLCIGEFNGSYVVASESVALDMLNAKLVRDVYPGELIEIKNNGFDSYQLFNEAHKAHCFFEYVYFARADSIIDGHSVYETRKRIGLQLAKEQPVDADIIVPIPDSGRSHAYGFSFGSGIQLTEGFIKNRYVARTFIMPDQKIRDIGVKEKVNPIKSVIDEKKVVLVDDSIVRGTTMRRIVQIVRDAGAKEVHVRIGCPPIIAPCYFGIDMKTREELIAPKKEIGEIRKEIEADSLGYISVDGLVKALNISKNNLCLGCITGEYPTQIPGEKYRFQKKLDKWK